MTIKPEITLSQRSLGTLEAVMTAAAIRTANTTARVAAEGMEREVVAIIKREMFWDRAPRRRKTQTTKLVNSFVGVVEGEGTTRVTARLTLKSGVNAKKVAALEYGSPPHEISPRGWDGEDDGGGSDFLWFPDPRQARGPAWNAYGPNNFRTKVVVHPGRAGFHMMRRAREHVRTRVRVR